MDMVRGGAVEQEPEVVEETAGEVVELTYRPTAEDFASALRARLRVSRLGWLVRWVPVLMGCSVAVQLGVYLALGGDRPSVGSLAAMLVAAVMVPLLPWLTGRRLARYTERQGVFRVTVTESGVSVATDTATTTITWQAQPRYRETDRVFVLVSDDKNATGFTMLPKHGLPDRADVDRLRAILDRHLTRC
ncbi:YcxB family protein [Streptomyces sp. DSM 110735]|uniref:YcxB family protein n=1 Tax=Streptomyces sp. DSM 110735 TaxID=2775031 RepID=UPI0018F43C3F|nr:YcxB family protein [Streptomyces sp. DSM 110735]MBJ7903600.1 YcxB family protein [Streptomyces sp. DSM 110735]